MHVTGRIAILLATYNGEKYIEKQLNSIVAQSNKDWTVYIHDDGSKDRTMEKVHRYTALYPELFKLVEGKPTGSAKTNFLYLLGQVDAPYYMFCDQDDVWLPEKIERTISEMKRLEQEAQSQLETLNTSGRVGSVNIRPDANAQLPIMVFTELRVVDEKLKTIAETMSAYQGLDCSKTSRNRLMIQNVVTGCTAMVNRSLRNLMIQYRNADRIIMHDWWGALLAAEFGRIAFLEEPLILYRQHDKNNVGALDIGDMGFVARYAGQRKKIRQALAVTRTQVQEMVDCFGMDEDSVAAKYAASGNWWKPHRLWFYFKNDIKKGDRIRNMGLIVWG